MKNCALVIRVSDERQGEKTGSSPDSQSTQLHNYIKWKNSEAEANPELLERYEVYREFRLIGVRGKDSFKSEEFLDLKADIERGNVDVVMATSLDRFGRNVVGFLQFFRFLHKRKVDLVVTHYSIDTATPIGQLVITILMALAEMQSLQLSKKIMKSRHTHLVVQGRKTGSSIPLGFDRHPTETGLYVINEREAPIVRLAFQLYLKHQSLAAVSRVLNEKGHKTRKGNDFRAGNLKYLLENRIYIGELEEHKENKGKPNSEVPEEQRYMSHKPPNPDQWPKLVSEEVFERVQEILSKKSRSNRLGSRRTYAYILSGLAICGLCDKPMEPDKGRGSHYYACKNKECPGRKLIHERYSSYKRNSIPAKALDDALKKLLAKLVLHKPSRIDDIAKAANAIIPKSSSTLQGELRSIRARIASTEETRDELLKAQALQEDGSEEQLELNRMLRDALKQLRELRPTETGV